MAGTSGKDGSRLALVTPSALSLPARTCACTLPTLANIISTWPASTSCTAGAGQPVRPRGRGPALWDVHDVDVGHHLEGAAGQVDRRADRADGEVQPPR